MILITGASSGLGAALGRLYGKEKRAMTLTGRNKQRLNDVALDCGEHVNTITASLSNHQHVEQLFEQFTSPPSLVIHCAGSGYFGPLEDQDPGAMARLVENNLLSTMYLLKQLVARYKHCNTTVAIVMSTAALSAKAGETTYCAVKWGVKGLLESTRLELKGYPMKLIAVYPGGMATDFWSTSGKDLDSSEFMTADEAASMLKSALTSTEHGYVSDITINRN
ncbi:SDR family NAD(P)-dependent oxidoreductase [Vibrio tapetis subsp. quintayensis]|uniref:SDR family NAD(P)-dependent oxidoreductase n=1 Tax=Vibrio tapetis TaxID=52443 RepID=UPI0025B53382|nr:SDR family NAD(P)-dependent oxidoreductase [Vibrio tapetis]MDN3681237.1 SDR family NAD(P)-dependent oxidoreductase [Vibrio tapetis subsp. quintayensis]